MVEKISFYSPGKLLITGEFVVLNGARALAVPLRLGQQMDVYSINDNTDFIEWTAEDTEDEFFQGRFSKVDFSVLQSNDNISADYVSGVLQGAKQLNPHFLEGCTGCKVSCSIEFSRNFGFGSSSTLICNIAEWAGVDALELNALVTRGSGYDVAVGLVAAPIIYQRLDGKSESYKVELNYTFTDKMWLVYLGNKQSSAGAILSYNPDPQVMKDAVREINQLTNDIIEKKTVKGFQKAMLKHEECIGALLEKEPVQKRLFDDFNGQIKSLGAWGGDFILAVSEDSPSMIYDYFSAKGFNTLFSFDELVLKNDVNEE